MAEAAVNIFETTCALGGPSKRRSGRAPALRLLDLPVRGKSKLRILLVEDDIADAELIEHQLESAGFDFALTRVQTESDFRRQLQAELPDVILSDHGLPLFSGFKALEITRAEFPRLPFIFVSGSNDQGMVAFMYDSGATDYVFKRDLGDLKVALLNALEEAVESQPLLDSIESLRDPSVPELSVALAPTALSKLYFCPRCWGAFDERKQPVVIESYCSSRPEITVVRQVCPLCA